MSIKACYYPNKQSNRPTICIWILWECHQAYTLTELLWVLFVTNNDLQWDMFCSPMSRIQSASPIWRSLFSIAWKKSFLVDILHQTQLKLMCQVPSSLPFASALRIWIFWETFKGLLVSMVTSLEMFLAWSFYRESKLNTPSKHYWNRVKFAFNLQKD